MDSFVVTAEIGGGSPLIFEFVRTGASAGTWSQIQVPKSGAIDAFGSWSQGPVNPGMAESFGRTMMRVGGDQSVNKDIWLYSNSSGKELHVADIAGFSSFPPRPGEAGKGGMTLFNSADQVVGVGACTGVSCTWQDVSNRGFLKESNWKFDTSSGQSGGGFMVSGASGSMWFTNEVLKAQIELFYYAVGVSIGLKLPKANAPAFIAPLLAKLKPLFDKAQALARSDAVKPLADRAQTMVKSAANYPAGKLAQKSQPGTAGSSTATFSAGFPLFYGPNAAPGELTPDALEGPCFMIDLSGSAIVKSGSATLFLFNANSPMTFLAPPTSWSAAALTCGGSGGLQFPGLAITISRGKMTRGYNKHV